MTNVLPDTVEEPATPGSANGDVPPRPQGAPAALAPRTDAHDVVTRIAPSRGWVSLKLHEVWEYRELLFFLIWRDVKVRYKQTVLGVLWAILQPLSTMVVFSLFFGKLAKMPSDELPYPVFSLAALVPWTFFANALAQSSDSLVGSSNLIKKVYFPRLVIPISASLAGLIDFSIAFVVLMCMMLGFGIAPTWNVIFLPAFLVLAYTTSLGVGLWLSALNVQFRDVKYTIPFMTQLWMFATPIAYPLSSVPAWLRPYYMLNPMVGIIDGYRNALLHGTAPNLRYLGAAFAVTFVLLVAAYFNFKRAERTFADVI